MNQSLYRSMKWGYLLLLMPGLILLITFYIFPLLNGIYLSLTNWDGISRTKEFVGLSNYINIFTDARFLNSLGFTFKYAVISTVLSNIIALSVALALVSKIKFQTFFRGVFFSPAILSLLIIGFIWKRIFNRFIPYIGELFNIEGLKTNLLANPDTVFWALIIVTVWQATAILIVIYMAGLQTVPQEVYESAEIDGAAGFKKFFSITLPLIIPSITICLILAIKSHLMVYDYIVAMTEGGPGFSTESITLLIFNLGLNNNQFGYGSAASIMLFLLIVVISFIQIYFLRKKEVQL
jgi:raffinose/stachyose/melibiose transport system permease protein